MTTFRFRFENDDTTREVYTLDLPSRELAETTTKYAARYLASRHVRMGELDLSQNILLEDEGGALVGSWPVRSFIHIS